MIFFIYMTSLNNFIASVNPSHLARNLNFQFHLPVSLVFKVTKNALREIIFTPAHNSEHSPTNSGVPQATLYDFPCSNTRAIPKSINLRSSLPSGRITQRTFSGYNQNKHPLSELKQNNFFGKLWTLNASEIRVKKGLLYFFNNLNNMRNYSKVSVHVFLSYYYHHCYFCNYSVLLLLLTIIIIITITITIIVIVTTILVSLSSSSLLFIWYHLSRLIRR